MLGIFGVGKAAVHQPALAVLSHTPKEAKETICWAGKGIVYDTGGLSIKGKVSMYVDMYKRREKCFFTLYFFMLLCSQHLVYKLCSNIYHNNLS